MTKFTTAILIEDNDTYKEVMDYLDRENVKSEQIRIDRERNMIGLTRKIPKNITETIKKIVYELE